MKYLMILFLMLIPWISQGQSETFKFDRGLVVRSDETDTTKYEFLYSINKCGKFVVDDSSVSFNLDGEKTTTYMISLKVIRMVVNKTLIYNRCIDFNTNEQIVFCVDKADATASVGKIIDGRYYLYIFYLKE